MGYELHITRAQDWTESDSVPITLYEWQSLIAADPEMQIEGVAEVATPEGTLRYENEGLAVWKKYSGHNVGGNKAWFDFRDGEIVVKNPDEEIIQKMVEIAARLHANVQGDEGERYPQESSQSASNEASFWRRLFGG